MDLELEITSYHRLSPTVKTSQKLSGQQLIIGRSEQCDWPLPDPDRVVSSQHAIISWHDNQYWVTDTSTNGLYLNNDSQPLGRQHEHPLQPADVLRIGDYEIVVKEVAAQPAVTPTPSADSSVTQPPAATVPPAASQVTPEPAPEEPAPQMAAPLSSSSFSSEPSAPTAAAFDQVLASDLTGAKVDDSHVDLPASQEIPTEWGWGHPPATAAEQQSPKQPEPEQQPLVQALIDGMGMTRHFENRKPDAELMRSLGNMTRTLLEHLLDLLQMRAEQKQKLRVQQTMFQRHENNPLKFSATAQDAIESLLLRPHNSFLGAEEAIDEAFIDIQTHEQALLQGVQQVIGELLDTGDSSAPQTLDKLPVVGKARAYERWQQHRHQLQQEYGDPDRLLRSDTFVEAYERAIRSK